MLSKDAINMLPERICERLSQINTEYLENIGNVIKNIGELRPSDVHHLQQMYNYSSDMDKVIKKLSYISGNNISDIYEMFDIVAEDNYNFSKPFFKARGQKFIPYSENTSLKDYVRNMAKQTADEYVNLTQSTAFAIFEKDGKSIAPLFASNKDKIATSLSDTYNKVVDYAVTKVQLGIEGYNKAMEDVVKALSGSGIRTVDYATGYSRRLDTAVRQNILWGVKECNQSSADFIGEQFGADGYEIDYHKYPRPSHADMGGKIYSKGEGVTIDGVYYPPFSNVAHLLEEFGCLHFKWSVILGVSKPSYSEEQLEAFKEEDNKTFTFEGKEYTMYQGTQLQRKIETAIREQRDLLKIAKSSGSKNVERETKEKIRLLTDKYNKLSKESGLPTKIERTKSALKVDKLRENGIMNFVKGSIFENSSYNPYDIKKAIMQKSTNFVTKNPNSTEYAYGLAVESIKPIEGVYDIKAHGDFDGIKVFDSAIDAVELARIIISRQDYNGQDIRLLSCNTGKEVNGTCVAKELAKLLGVNVYAPNDILVTDGKGLLRIGKNRFKNTGEFICFGPK